VLFDLIQQALDRNPRIPYSCRE